MPVRLTKKQREQIDEFPFLRSILDDPLEPISVGEDHDVVINSLKITLERPDPYLMLRQGRSIGVGNDKYEKERSGKFAGKIVRQGEYLYAISDENMVIDCFDWAEVGASVVTGKPTYAKDILRTIKPRGKFLTQSINPMITRLVWVRVKTWHDSIVCKEDGWPNYSRPLHRSVIISVYSQTDVGFDSIEARANLHNHWKITDEVIHNAILQRGIAETMIYGNIMEMCTQFVNRVYLAGLRDLAYPKDAHHANGRGSFDYVKVCVSEQGNIEHITLVSHSSFLSFQVRKTDILDSVVLPDLREFSGYLPEFRNMILTVTDIWRNEGAHNFSHIPR